MIDFHKQVPSIYPGASRDFQYLSWLFNIVLNSVKHNVDDLYNLPYVGFDSKLAELFALTLGFKVKRNYDRKQLAALAAILPSILRYKGTLKAVEMSAEALITASGALGYTDCEVVDSQLIVSIPKDISIDITLFLDLLDYILPAGMTCRVKREDRAKHTLDTIYVKHRDEFHYAMVKDISFADNKLSTGLSGLFNFDIIGKALTAGNLHTAEVLVSVNKIVLEADEAAPQIWKATTTASGLALHNDNRYLCSNDHGDLDFTSNIVYWHVTPGKLASTFRLASTDIDNRYIGYGNHTEGDAYFGVNNPADKGIFDLCIYKNKKTSDDSASRRVFTRIHALDEITDESELIIVAQTVAYEFAANLTDSGNGYEINTGLLSNTVIPLTMGAEIVYDDSILTLWSTEEDRSNKLICASGGIKLAARKFVQEL